MKKFLTLITKPYYAKDYYLKNYKKYMEVKELSKNNPIPSNLKKLNKCISFWKYRTQLGEINFKILKRNIKKNKLENNYKKYTNNCFEIFLDYYIWFVLHVTKRRNRSSKVNT